MTCIDRLSVFREFDIDRLPVYREFDVDRLPVYREFSVSQTHIVLSQRNTNNQNIFQGTLCCEWLNKWNNNFMSLAAVYEL